MRIAVYILATILTALGIISLYLFNLVYEPVVFSGYSDSLTLYPIHFMDHRNSYAHEGSPTEWQGAIYYQHDCKGCETQERVWLDVYRDSTARVIFHVDTLHVVRLPFIKHKFVRAFPWRIHMADAIMGEDCLFTLIPGRDLEYWKEYTTSYEAQLFLKGCTRPPELAFMAARFTKKDDRLVFEGLSSAMGQ